MSLVGVKHKKEFVQEFRAACKSLGITQSGVFKEAMIQLTKIVITEKVGYTLYEEQTH